MLNVLFIIIVVVALDVQLECIKIGCSERKHFYVIIHSCSTFILFYIFIHFIDNLFIFVVGGTAFFLYFQCILKRTGYFGGVLSGVNLF